MFSKVCVLTGMVEKEKSCLGTPSPAYHPAEGFQLFMQSQPIEKDQSQAESAAAQPRTNPQNN